MATATTTSFALPKWLVESKKQTSKCKEWIDLVEALYDVIEQELRGSHVHSVSQLTDAERDLFLQKAAAALQSDSTYNKLNSRMSILLDQHLNNNVAKQLLEEFPKRTKTDLILNTSLDGIRCLLRKWPDMKQKLGVCFNQPIIHSLRQTSWVLFLSNSKVRNNYMHLLMSNPKSAMSSLDLEISKHCEKLLMTESTFSHLNGSLGAFFAMKAVLSHYHSLTRQQDDLHDSVFMLMVPFVELFSDELPRGEPASSEIVTLLVEKFVSFMNSRHAVLRNTEWNVSDILKRFATVTSQHLHRLNPGLARILADIYKCSKDMVESTSKVSDSILGDAILALTTPVMRSFFVGFVALDVVFFVWDQYMLGLQAPEFQDAYLPAITAIFLLLLAPQLKTCATMQSMAEVLKKHGPQLLTQQFQFEISKHFYENLRSLLKYPVRATSPVLDPTNVTGNWVNWSSEKIPNRMTPDNRRQAREESYAEQQDKLQLAKEDAWKRQEDSKHKREAEERFNQEIAHQQQQHADKVSYLQKQLREEENRKKSAETNAAEMRVQLQQALDELEKLKEKSKHLLVQSLESSYRLYSSHIVNIGKVAEKTHTTNTTMDTASEPDTELMLDFMERVTGSYSKLAEGDDRDRAMLGDGTKPYILTHASDLREAEMEVFGRYLQQTEFTSLTFEEKEKAAEYMMWLMLKWRTDREAAI